MAPNFFIAAHTFNAGGADRFWARLSANPEAALKALADAAHAAGFHNHSFLPTSLTGDAHCVWEGAEGKTAAELQAFLDGPTGPSGPTSDMINVVYPVDPQCGPGYASFFDKSAAPITPKAPAGTLYMVQHFFKVGMEEKFWAGMSEMLGNPEAFAAFGAKANELGFNNNAFYPVSKAGPGTMGFCLWEAAPGKTAADMQAFIDGPNGPSNGLLVNVCHPFAADLGNLGAIELKWPAEPIVVKNFDQPDEKRPMSKCEAKVVTLGEGTAAALFEAQPGFSWRKDVAPVVGTEVDETAHLGMVLEGQMLISRPDGTKVTLGPMDVYNIQPGGNGGEVVGNVPFKCLEFNGVTASTFGVAAKEE